MERSEAASYSKGIGGGEAEGASQEEGLSPLTFQIKRAFPPLRPPPDFERSLGERLLREGQPSPGPEKAGLKHGLRQALLGVGGLFMASLVYLLWRKRRPESSHLSSIEGASGPLDPIIKEEKYATGDQSAHDI